MSVHRMDFLVEQHQAELMREARDQRLSASLHGSEPRTAAQSGGLTLAPMRHAIKVVWHDVRGHHLHRHQLGHHV